MSEADDSSQGKRSSLSSSREIRILKGFQRIFRTKLRGVVRWCWSMQSELRLRCCDAEFRIGVVDKLSVSPRKEVKWFLANDSALVIGLSS